MNLLSPIFFEPNRVWRPYTGGRLLAEFVGSSTESNGHYSEDWLASDIRANADIKNPQAVSSDPDEGLSRIYDDVLGSGPTLVDILHSGPETLLGADHIVRYGPHMAVHCRLADTADDLPVGCITTSTEESETPAEAMYILATRETDDGHAKLRVGLKEGFSAEDFAAAAASDTVAIDEMLHTLSVQPGETYFIPGGMPRAVGAGVFMLKVQTPGREITTHDETTDAFICEPLSEDDLLRRIKVHELVIHRSDEGFYSEEIGSDRTNAFSLWRVEVLTQMQLRLPRPFAVVVCTAGAGQMNWAGGSRDISAGEFFLQPFGVPWIEYVADGRLSLQIVMPPVS
jgi:mannose-6-phosphate isomerase